MNKPLSQLARELFPYLQPYIEKVSRSGGSSSGSGVTTVATHALNSTTHTGVLGDAQAPQFLLRDGSRSVTGPLAMDPGVTIDGMDPSAHKADPDAHHKRASGGPGIVVDTNQVVTVNEGDGLLFNGAFLEVDPDDGIKVGINGVGVKLNSTSPGLAVDSNGLRALLETPYSGLELTPSGIGLADSVAGAGLGITNKVLQVNLDRGLEYFGDSVRVDEDFAFTWTGIHQFLARPEIYNNLIFKSGHRTITTDAGFNLTLAPTQDLVLDPGGLILLPDAQELRTMTFTDLPTGIGGIRLWDRGGGYRQLTMGAGKFDELFVRVFVADETRLDRGEEYWSKSFGIVETDFTVPADEQVVSVWFEDAVEMPGVSLFSVNDWLLLRTVDWGTGLVVAKHWFQVVSKTTQDTVNNRQLWVLRLKTGTSGIVVKKGNTALDVGVSGQGWIHLSALKQDGGPFIQVGNWTGTDPSLPSNFNIRTRMGNLNGTVDYSADTWGVAAGNNLGLTPTGGFSGFAADNLNGLRLFNTEVDLYNGATLVAQWTPKFLRVLASDGVTGVFAVYSGVSTLSHGGWVMFNGDVAIGTAAGQHLWFDQSTGILELKGRMIISGSGSSGIGSFSDAGALATLDNVNWSTQVAARPTELTDGRIAKTIHASGYIDPTVNIGASAPAAGLYLGSDKMGYYQTTPVAKWKTYMDNTGKFYFAGNGSAFIAWDGTNLYGSDGSNTQWRASSVDGKLYAAQDNVRLDYNGVSALAESGAIGSTPPDPSSFGSEHGYGLRNSAGTTYAMLYGRVDTTPAPDKYSANLWIDIAGMSTQLRLSCGPLLAGAGFAPDNALEFNSNPTGSVRTARLQSDDVTIWGESRIGMGTGTSTSPSSIVLYDTGVIDITGNFGAWTTAAYGTGYASFDATNYHAAAYRKVGDLVMLRGTVIRNSGTGTTIFTLPAGYRPTRRMTFSVNGGNNEYTRVDVLVSGVVQWVLGGSPDAYVSLDGILFSVL